MAPWGPLQRQLLTYLVHHPQFRKVVKSASQKVMAYSTFQKAKQNAYSIFEKAGRKAACRAGSAGRGTAGRAGEYIFKRWNLKCAEQWRRQMLRAVRFIFANLMTFVVLIQLEPMLWHCYKRGVRYLTSSNSALDSEQGERRLKKKGVRTEDADAGFQDEAPVCSIRRSIMQSVPQPADSAGHAEELASQAVSSQSPWEYSSSLFDDTAEVCKSVDVQQTFNNVHKDVFRASNGDVQIDFNTSFLVKMGDETTFTSSLERESLTGSVSSHT